MIILTIKPEAFSFLQNTLENHIKTLSMTGMNPLIKKELIDDISKIKITIRNAKKGEENGVDNLDRSKLG